MKVIVLRCHTKKSMKSRKVVKQSIDNNKNQLSERNNGNQSNKVNKSKKNKEVSNNLSSISSRKKSTNNKVKEPVKNNSIEMTRLTNEARFSVWVDVLILIFIVLMFAVIIYGYII